MRDGSSTVLSSLISWIWTLVLVGAAIGAGVLVMREFDVVEVSKWASLPTFLSVPLQRQGDNAIMATLAGVVSGFLLLFLAGYVVQALVDALRLGWVARSLDGLDPAKSPPLSQRSWMYYPLFTRLWREFAQSLRHSSRLDPISGQRIIDYYATQPAEMVFSHQALVDVPMRVEFFRHLPGILTGSGIVSTFAGILMGLTGFDPSVGADQVTKELQVLFMGVSTAFTASFFAIVTAILVTVLEKFLLHWRYAQVAALQGRLNQRFGMDEAMTGADGHSSDGEMLALKLTGFLSRLETLLIQGHEEAKASRDAFGALPEWANQWRNETVERFGQVLSATLEGQVAPLVHAVEVVASRETQFREEMNTHRAQWSALEARLEQYQERQLVFQEGEIKRRQEADSTQEARMNGFVTTLEHHFGRQLAFMEGDAVQRQEGVSTLDARLGQLGTALETQFREEMNTHCAQWSALEARLEQYQDRQLVFQEGDTKRRQEADSTQEARMNGLVTTLEHHFGRQLAFMEGDAVQRQEGVSTLDARLGQLGTALETHLGRQVTLLENEAVQRQEYSAAQEVRLSQLGSALDTQLKRQVTLLENEVVQRQEGLSTLEARLSQLGSAIDTQLKRQVTLLENEAVRRQEGLSTLEARLGQLGATIETQLKRQVALFEKEAVQRQEGVSTLEARLGQVGTTLDTQLKRQVVLLEKESVQRQEEVSKLDAHLGHLANTLDTQLGRQVVLLEKESVQRQEGVSRLEERLVQLENTLDKQLGRQVVLLENESMQRQEGVFKLDAHLVQLENTLETQLGRQVGLLENESMQRQEGVSRLEERLTTLGSMLAGHFERQVVGLEEEGTHQGQMISLLGRLNEQGEQTTDVMRILRADVLGVAGQLQKEVAEILERIPSTQEVALVLRDADQEVREHMEAQFMQLAGQVEAVQGEIMARIAATATALKEGSEGVTGRLMELFAQRMDEMSTGLAMRLQELSERIALDRLALEELLRELQGKVEHAVLTDEKGMTQLFGQMGQEMERMRIQLRESVGDVVVQTREITAQGDEQIKFMMGGMSEEFNGALQAMAEAKRELDKNREAVLVERLVKQTAKQAEEIKLAVLDGLEVTTKRLAKQIRKTDEEQSRTQEESAQEMVNVIAQRMETAFGGVSEELAEMRTRLVSEQRAMEQSLQEWVKEASQSSLQESKVLSQRIMEVQVKLDERHHGVIGVIDQLGDGLASDLEQLRDGLYHKNEESSRQVEAHLTELGSVLEGVVTSLGREQAVFIEMLGERLDTLRRRLHVK